jgi:hypothetical protein
VSRSVPPARSTMTVRSSRSSSRRIWCPFGAPNPRNPLPGASHSPGGGPRLSPLVIPGRPTSARAPVGRRTSSRGSIPASVRLRRFPRPWRLAPPRARWSVSSTHAPGVRFPSPRCLPPVVRSEDLPSRGSSMGCVPRCVSHGARGARVHSGGSWPTPCRAAAETATRAAEPPLPPRRVVPAPAPHSVSGSSPGPDHRGGRSSGLPVPVGRGRSSDSPGHRDGEPSRPFGPSPTWGCLSCASRPRPGMSQTTAGLAGQRARACGLPKGATASNPPALPTGPPLGGPPVRVLPAWAPFSRCRTRRDGRVSPELLATRTRIKL